MGGGINPPLVGFGAPVYDWRELQRWKIEEALLPHGSIVQFRQPTVLQQYRSQIIGALAIVLFQAALIAGLLFERQARKRAAEQAGKARMETGRYRENLAHLVRVHTVGEIDLDAAGNLYLCVVSGTPGTWRQLSGPTTAGQLHLTPPGRVYDSRAGLATKLAFGDADRVVTVTTVIAGQPSAGSTIVPVGATGVLASLAVTATEGAGFLGLYSNALATWPGNASINWVAKDSDISNSVTVAVDAIGRIKVNIGGQGAGTKTHFVIDVVGYYA